MQLSLFLLIQMGKWICSNAAVERCLTLISEADIFICGRTWKKKYHLLRARHLTILCKNISSLVLVVIVNDILGSFVLQSGFFICF